MSSSVVITKGTPLTATAAIVAPYNIHRKGLLVGTNGGDLKFAFGSAPEDKDFVSMKDGDVLIFDSLVPVADLWAKGSGNIVVGEDS